MPAKPRTYCNLRLFCLAAIDRMRWLERGPPRSVWHRKDGRVESSTKRCTTFFVLITKCQVTTPEAFCGMEQIVVVQ